MMFFRCLVSLSLSSVLEALCRDITPKGMTMCLIKWNVILMTYECYECQSITYECYTLLQIETGDKLLALGKSLQRNQLDFAREEWMSLYLLRITA